MNSDKIKLALRLVARGAKQKFTSGGVPTFLGARGMLALMFENIRKFSEAEEDQTEHVLDLAVNALFAFAVSLPDIDIPDADEIPDDHEEEEKDPDDPRHSAETEANDPRWTPVAPGTPLPSIVKQEDEDDGD